MKTFVAEVYRMMAAEVGRKAAIDLRLAAEINSFCQSLHDWDLYESVARDARAFARCASHLALQVLDGRVPE